MDIQYTYTYVIIIYGNLSQFAGKRDRERCANGDIMTLLKVDQPKQHIKKCQWKRNRNVLRRPVCPCPAMNQHIFVAQH